MKIQSNAAPCNPGTSGIAMTKILVSILLLSGVLSALTYADTPSANTNVTPIACSPELPSITAGQHVSIKCGDLPKGISVYLQGTDGKRMLADQAPTLTEQALTFLVPANIVGGQSYSVLLTSADKSLQVPGQLTVVADTAAPVSVTAIYPLTNYPLGKGFDFEIAGKNFARLPQDNTIEVVNEGLVSVCPDTLSSTKSLCLANIEVIDTNRLKVHGFFPSHYYGPIQIKVHVGKNVSEEKVSVNFAAATPQGVAVAAAFVFGALSLLFFSLVRKGIGTATINGEKFGPATSLFLDRETNSYSLSKFQVLAWTATTVYAYTYLFLCRTLIQGDFMNFPGVAQNIPQLFFVSAGTTVAATAITANWGPKGAGPIKPSVADFISSGGFVAGDRFQFFIWTVVGCMGYVYLVVRSDPASLKDLPAVPDSFLYLMGVSSAGYLGGKVFRKPGPVIKVLSVANVSPERDGATPADLSWLKQEYRPKSDIKITAPVLTINVKGENLDPNASIKVDEETLRGDMFWITWPAQPDPQSGFCSDLNISLNNAGKYLQDCHTLSLVNRDGQGATVNFPIDPLSIDMVPDVTKGSTDVTVKVTGKNFVDGMTATWTEARAKDTDPVNKTNATIKPGANNTELMVSFVPGQQAGTGTLTILSNLGLKAAKEVTVRDS
jgi:hypothetical protein